MIFENSTSPLEFLRDEWPRLLAIPMFRELYHERRQRPTTMAAFFGLPLLTKDILAAVPISQRCLGWPSEVSLVCSSGGTTRAPVLMPWGQEDEAVATRAATTAHGRIRWSPEDVVLILAPLGLGSMWRHMERQVRVTGATALSPGVIDLSEAIQMALDLGVTVIVTLPSIAARLGERVAHMSAVKHRVREIICGGDVLSEQRRLRISELWSADCWNFYGISELFGPLAAECPLRQGLHVDRSVFIEVLPSRSVASGGGTHGEAVLTALWSRPAPMVRFVTGDLVTILEEPCACGDPSRLLRFHGKTEQCPVVHGRRILLDEIDDTILSAGGTGLEWQISGSTAGPLCLHVERSGANIDSHALLDSVSSLIRAPIKISPVGKLDAVRRQAKPLRFQLQDV